MSAKKIKLTAVLFKSCIDTLEGVSVLMAEKVSKIKNLAKCLKAAGIRTEETFKEFRTWFNAEYKTAKGLESVPGDVRKFLSDVRKELGIAADSSKESAGKASAESRKSGKESKDSLADVTLEEVCANDDSLSDYVAYLITSFANAKGVKASDTLKKIVVTLNQKIKD